MPVNIHSWNWAWYSKPGVQGGGSRAPKTFDEFVADAPKLKAAGIIPLAIGGDGNGWQINGLSDVITDADSASRSRDKMYGKKDLTIAGGPDVLKVLTELKALKQFTDDGYANRNWNDTTNLVITGKAGSRSWATGRAASSRPPA